jgi:putative nucleotidyltransferase with HDIG domain
METSKLADSNTTPVPVVSQEDKVPSPWLPVYIYSISILGVVVAFIALLDFPADWGGLLLFAGLASIAQLGDVELFTNSRSRVSVASVMAIASILLFGPMAGALVQLSCGVMTAITTTLRSRQAESGRASMFIRTAFNTSMLVISTAAAGWTYVLAGGSIGVDNIYQVSNLIPLIVAVTVDVLVNLILLIMVISLQTKRSPIHIWEHDFRWAAPIAIAGGVIGGGVLAVAYDLLWIVGIAVFFLPILATSYSFRTYVNNMKGYVDKLEDMNLTLGEINLGLLETLGAIIDAYDVYTYGHSTQVATYASAIAEKMDLPPDEQARVVKAALIHDLGKVGIMDSIISKPGPLTDEEYNILKRHPVIGAEIINRMKGFQDLVPLVRHHHERWDGRGYPDGLEKDEIPVGARILALSDSLDAMLSDRPYRPTRSMKEVVEEVIRCTGTQFDPQVVEAFFEVKAVKPRDFFKNSAAFIDKSVLVNQMGYISGGMRYFIKKDMLNKRKN